MSVRLFSYLFLVDPSLPFFFAGVAGAADFFGAFDAVGAGATDS